MLRILHSILLGIVVIILIGETMPLYIVGFLMRGFDFEGIWKGYLQLAKIITACEK